MKILVTGGTGSVGRALIQRLSDHGHRILVVGRSPGAEVPGADYEVCDVADYDRLCRLMRGFEAVIHLAAIRSPGSGPGRTVFSVNAGGTFTVYEAAAANGIRRVVSASSINALGYHFGRKLFPIQYLPIDEHHLSVTTDAYSFSKQIVEQTAEYFWHREGISGACIRLPKTLDFNTTDHSSWSERIKGHLRFVKGLLDLDDPSRREKLSYLDRQFERLGAAGFHETRGFDASEYMSADELDFMIKKTDFWAWIDARDSAQIFEKCATAEYNGSHTLFANAALNEVKLPIESLARLYVPTPAVRHGGESGRPEAPPAENTLVCIRRARDLVGYEPEYNALAASMP